MPFVATERKCKVPSEIDAYSKILPLVGVDYSDPPQVHSHVLGTAFVATNGVLVTCWHVLREAVQQGWMVIAALDERGDGQFTRLDVSEIAQHPTGDDLASARIDLPGAGWRLPSRDVPVDLGTNVVTMGYPLPDVRQDNDGGLTHLLSFRMLKGYVTHMPVVERSGYPPAASFELDMPAPEGVSGSPLLHGGERNVLLGVVYGTHEVARIESLSSVDPETGARNPEILKIVPFALAHHTRTLRSLRGPATGGRYLGALMQERGETVDL